MNNLVAFSTFMILYTYHLSLVLNYILYFKSQAPIPRAVSSHCLLFLAAGNHQSALCPCESAFSDHVTETESRNTCPLVAGSFHLV